MDDRKRPYEKANIILKLIFVIQKGDLRKIQGALSNKEKRHGCLTFGSGCTGGQSTAQVTRLQRARPKSTAQVNTAPKARSKNYFQDTFSKSTVNFNKKTKEHYPTQKISENDLYLILGALVGIARPRIW